MANPILASALLASRRKRTEPASDPVVASDEGFIGPTRMRDRLKARFGKFGAFNKKIQDKFAARRAKFGGKTGLGGVGSKRGY